MDVGEVQAERVDRRHDDSCKFRLLQAKLGKKGDVEVTQ